MMRTSLHDSDGRGDAMTCSPGVVPSAPVARLRHDPHRNRAYPFISRGTNAVIVPPSCLMRP